MYRNRNQKDTSTEGMASLQGSVALTRILGGLLKHSSQYWREKLKLEDGARPSCRRQYKNHKRHLGLSETEREKLNETVGKIQQFSILYSYAYSISRSRSKHFLLFFVNRESSQSALKYSVQAFTITRT